MINFVNGEKALQGAKAKGTTILNIYAEWCGPCKMLAPVLEEVSKKTTVFKVNLDENKEFAKSMKIKGVPTTFIFKDGLLTETLVGFVPKEAIEAKL